MRLRSCHIKNFMGIHELEVDLDADGVLFIGDNGAGKSSALKALRIAIGALLREVNLKDVSAPAIQPWMMRHVIEPEGFDTVTRHAGETRVAVRGDIEDQEIVWALARSSAKSSRMRWTGARDLRAHAKHVMRAAGMGEPLAILPLVGYFGARRTRGRSRRTAGKKPEARAMGYANALDSSLDVNRMLSRWDRIDHMASKPQAREVRDALEACLAALIPGEVKVAYEPDLGEPVVRDGDETRTFSALSDGYRNVLEIGMDLALRGLQLNPALGRDAITRTPGVVLIDEVGQHLHPSWQIEVLKRLREAFPAIQFIVSSHSPFVALHAGEGIKIYRMSTGPEGPKAEIVQAGESVESALRGEAFGPLNTWGPALLRAAHERAELLGKIGGKPSTTQQAQIAANSKRLEQLGGLRPTATEDLVREVAEGLDLADLDQLDESALALRRTELWEEARKRREARRRGEG